MTRYSHYTVLKKEAIAHLVTNPNGLYVDATCGGGGHSEELLSIFPHARLIACDWDMKAIEATRKRLSKYGPRVDVQYGSLGLLSRMLKQRLHIHKVDGILADFGTSRYHIENAAGFSFMHDTKLDMRMSPGHQKMTAARIVNNYSQKALEDILEKYGEEKHTRKIVNAICEERLVRPIRTTLHLAELIKNVVPPSKKRTHPATQTFQALRIAVNGELDQISTFLHHAPEMLNEGGRLVTISFHSLEDRIVKYFAQSHKDIFTDVIDGVQTPSEKEIDINPPSRSAKMRVLQRK